MLHGRREEPMCDTQVHIFIALWLEVEVRLLVKLLDEVYLESFFGFQWWGFLMGTEFIITIAPRWSLLINIHNRLLFPSRRLYCLSWKRLTINIITPLHRLLKNVFNTQDSSLSLWPLHDVKVTHVSYFVVENHSFGLYIYLWIYWLEKLLVL